MSCVFGKNKKRKQLQAEEWNRSLKISISNLSDFLIEKAFFFVLMDFSLKIKSIFPWDRKRCVFIIHDLIDLIYPGQSTERAAAFLITDFQTLIEVMEWNRAQLFGEVNIDQNMIKECLVFLMTPIITPMKEFGFYGMQLNMSTFVCNKEPLKEIISF